MNLLTTNKMRVSDLLIAYLRQEHVQYIFGITGKNISPIFDSALDFTDINTITTSHEGGASFMAYGYAQATKKLGVCCATTGGGITNLLTGIAAAYVHSLPILVITGQVPSEHFGKNAFQESTGYGRTMDAVTLLRSITKDSFMLISPNKANEAFQYAIRLAITGRQGPVHINIPIDIQLTILPQTKVVARELFIPQNGPSCSHSAISQALECIAQAKRPVFVLGWGAVFSGGNEILVKLAELLNIPIATTVQGKGGISADHPLYLGVMGLCGHRIAKQYVLEESDLILAVGTGFGEFNTLNWNPKIKETKLLIQIDIDPTEIGKNYPVEIGLVGDAKLILNQLYKLAQERLLSSKIATPIKKKRSLDWNYCFDVKKTFSSSIPILPQALLREIRENTPDNSVFIGDSSANWCWVNHYIPILSGGMYYPTQGLGSMGTGIASAIGIKLAHPNQPVICICGDGSFLMNGNEIATAVHYNIQVIWIIFNDQRYTMPYIGTEKLYGKGRAENSCILPKIDFKKVSKGYGAVAYTANKPGDIKIILAKALYLNKPVVIDTKINVKETPPLEDRLNYG